MHTASGFAELAGSSAAHTRGPAITARPSATTPWLQTFMWNSASLVGARVISRDRRDLLIGQRRCDAAHRGVLANTRSVVLQCLDQISILLAAELRHRIDLRKSRAIARDTMAALATADVGGRLSRIVIRHGRGRTRNGQRGEYKHASDRCDSTQSCVHSQYTRTY